MNKQEDAQFRKELEEGRKLEIEAAIVRVMKARQTIAHNLLIVEVGAVEESLLLEFNGGNTDTLGGGTVVTSIPARPASDQVLHRVSHRQGVHGSTTG